MIHLLLIFFGVIGLFSTGPGGRHDWMRFHADEVPCPSPATRFPAADKESLKIPCIGNLKWFKKPTILECDTCRRQFKIQLLRKKS